MGFAPWVWLFSSSLRNTDGEIPTTFLNTVENTLCEANPQSDAR